MLLLVALLAAAALVEVTITTPPVAVRWRADVDRPQREALERRHELRNGQPDPDAATTWRYTLGDRSPERIRALIDDPAVEDTAYIDRAALTARDRSVRVGLRPLPRPLVNTLEEVPLLLRFHRSAWLFVAGSLLLWMARFAVHARRAAVLVTVPVVGTMMLALPLDPSFVQMGESGERTSRAGFEDYYGERVRFEKHLSQVILLERYRQLGPDATAAEQALADVARGGAVWFVISALAIGALERWSAVVLRYLGLSLLAPAALLYFGWREFAYLSVNVATVPLLVQGLRARGVRLEGAAASAGVGAALHGAGLVSLAGVWLAAIGSPGRLRERAARMLRVSAWGTAAYVGWVAIYVIVLHLPIESQSQGTAWRPLWTDEVREGRLAPALVSPTGARDLAMEAWIVGLPLAAVGASLARAYRHEWRTAIWYLGPSLIFLVLRWPFTGIGPGMDIVVAGFPAFHALAWICAHDPRRSTLAAVILATAHAGFWWAVLDPRFEVVGVG